jgi:hypothetical protein
MEDGQRNDGAPTPDAWATRAGGGDDDPEGGGAGERGKKATGADGFPMVSATSLRAARKVLRLASDLAREELLKALAQNPRFRVRNRWREAFAVTLRVPGAAAPTCVGQTSAHSFGL